MQINVTQECIDLGKRGDKCFCPVATAIRWATGQIAVVTHKAIKYGYGKVVKMPPQVDVFVWAFDQGIGVEPFSFELPDGL